MAIQAIFFLRFKITVLIQSLNTPTSTTSSVCHSYSCCVNQPVSSRDLQTIIGRYPFEAPSALCWVPTWQLFPLLQKALGQPSMPDVFSRDTLSNKSFEQDTTDRKQKKEIHLTQGPR